MSRTAVLGIVFVAVGLSGCAGPAKIVRADASTVVVAVPDDTNSWPFYYEDEARRRAAEYIHDPVKVGSERVKVGEQAIQTQDVTRRELDGKEGTPGGEKVTSLNTASVSDQFEYHLKFQSRGPVRGPGGIDMPPPPIPGGPPLPPAGGPSLIPAGGAVKPPAATEEGASVDIIPPAGTPTSLPPTRLTLPGNR